MHFADKYHAKMQSPSQATRPIGLPWSPFP